MRADRDTAMSATGLISARTRPAARGDFKPPLTMVPLRPILQQLQDGAGPRL